MIYENINSDNHENLTMYKQYFMHKSVIIEDLRKTSQKDYKHLHFKENQVFRNIVNTQGINN